MLRTGPWAINAIVITIDEGHIGGEDQGFETCLFNLTSKLSLSCSLPNGHLFKGPGILQVPTLPPKSPVSSHTGPCPFGWVQFCSENNWRSMNNCFCSLDKTSPTHQQSLTHKNAKQAEPWRCTQPVLSLDEMSLNHRACQLSLSAALEDLVLSSRPDCSGSKRKQEAQAARSHCYWPSAHCVGNTKSSHTRWRDTKTTARSGREGSWRILVSESINEHSLFPWGPVMLSSSPRSRVEC